MKLNFIRPLGIAAILLLCAVFSSCNDDIYSNADKQKFKAGDTIYVRYAGQFVFAVVQSNDKNKKMLTIKRQNVYDTKGVCDQLEIWSYYELP